MEISNKNNFIISILTSDGSTRSIDAFKRVDKKNSEVERVLSASTSCCFAKNFYRVWNPISIRLPFIKVIVINALVLPCQIVALVAYTIFDLLKLVYERKGSPLKNVVESSAALLGNVIFGSIGAIGLISPKWSLQAYNWTLESIIKRAGKDIAEDVAHEVFLVFKTKLPSPVQVGGKMDRIGELLASTLGISDQVHFEPALPIAPEEIHPEPLHILDFVSSGLDPNIVVPRIKRNVERYFGEVPSWMVFRDGSSTVEISIPINPTLCNLPKKNGIKPWDLKPPCMSHTIFGYDCRITNTWYYDSAVAKVFPQRFTAAFKKLECKDEAEIDEVLREIKTTNLTEYYWIAKNRKRLINTHPDQIKEALRSQYLVNRLQSTYTSSDKAPLVVKLCEKHGLNVLIPILDHRPSVRPIQLKVEYAMTDDVLVSANPELLRKLWQASDLQCADRARDSVMMEKLYTALPDDIAHGVKRDSGGLTTLINIMLEGGMRKPYYAGPLGGELVDRLDICSGCHGPFYVMMGTKDNPIKAYLVPFDQDKQTVLEVLNLAVQCQTISSLDREELSGKIFTIEEYIDSSK